MDDIAKQHVTEKITRVLCRMTLNKNVEVSETAITIADPSIRICHIKRANELAVIDQFNFLMVSLEELRNMTSKKVHSPVSKRIVPNTNATSCLQVAN